MATATLRFARLKPRKTRLVADLVRGVSVPEARNILNFSTQAAAPIIRKVVDSAAANAMELDPNLTDEDLIVREIQVNDGPRMKRFRPRARGMATPIIKRTSHITVVVTEIE